MSRRAVLGGMGTALAGLFARPAWAFHVPPRARAAILVWLGGGPSHVDTFDPKPGTDVAGPLGAIDSTLGVQVSELFPHLAGQLHRASVIRSMSSGEEDHGRAYYLLHTGHAMEETVQHPSMGSLSARFVAGEEGDVPPYVAMSYYPPDTPGLSAGLLGDVYAPFLIADPAAGVALGAPVDLEPGRWRRRLAALREIERRRGDRAAETQRELLDRLDRYGRGPLARALDVAQEPDAVRYAYGAGDAGPIPFGQACLAARRLVEGGVRFVEVVLDGWDTHSDNFALVRDLAGQLDPALAGLIADLDDRGLLDSTLVLCMGEFGRTPAINATAGRDHHGRAFSALVAGGGTRRGQVIGATDATGTEVADRPVSPQDLFATVARLSGIDADQRLYTPDGRPVRVVEDGTPIEELL